MTATSPNSRNTHQVFDGDTIEPAHDDARLTRQLERVFEVMKGGDWRSLLEIADLIGDASTPGVSARLRDLRKPRFGGYEVQRRRRTEGTFEYKLVILTSDQSLFGCLAPDMRHRDDG